MLRKVLLVVSILWALSGCARAAQPLTTVAAPVKTEPPAITPLPAIPPTEMPSPYAMPGLETILGAQSTPDTASLTEMGSDKSMAEFDGGHAHAGPHVQMTSVWPARPGDRERAAQVEASGRQAMAKYADYRAALADGFQIIAPGVPQDVYHFTRFSDYIAALHHFDPARPSALLYQKTRDGYKWVGLMYSAPYNASEAELNALYPLSVSPWHAHVNVCVPVGSPDWNKLLADSQFGLAGSITTEADCQAAGGIFKPDAFGWMVHVYFKSP